MKEKHRARNTIDQTFDVLNLPTLIDFPISHNLSFSTIIICCFCQKLSKLLWVSNSKNVVYLTDFQYRSRRVRCAHGQGRPSVKRIFDRALKSSLWKRVDKYLLSVGHNKRFIGRSFGYCILCWRALRIAWITLHYVDTISGA
jgi:hypothetical protein